MKLKSIDDLKPAAYNPREISSEAMSGLKRSVREFGDVSGIVWSSRHGHLVCGHQRLAALRTLYGDGLLLDAKVPCLVTPTGERFSIRVVDWDLTIEKAANLAANNPAIAGEFTEDVTEIIEELKEEIPDLAEDLRLEEIALDLDVPDKPAPVEEDEVPEPPKDPITKPGDLWILGRHRLLCGDCRDGDTLARLMRGERYDLLVTDPPYGVSYAAKNEFLNVIAPGNRIQTPIVNDHGTPEEMEALWLAAFTAIRQFAKPGASYYVTGPQGGDLLLLLLNLRASGFPLRHMLVWAKNNHVLGRSDYHYKHEPIIYGWVEGAHRYHGGTSETSLWEIDKPHESKLHPTMKPVELYARAIRNSSAEGEIVCDPFEGSGTCAVAAEQLFRRCYGLEIDPHYCDVIVERWQNLTGEKARRETP